MNDCASVLDSIAKGTSRSHDLLIKINILCFPTSPYSLRLKCS